MEGKAKLKEIMERVRSEVEKEPIELEINGKPVKKSLSVSLGGAVSPSGQQVDPDKFIHLVDTHALYQAKDEGRNTTFVLNYDKPKALAA
jgi:PleD family two-component response regulator